MDNDKPVSKLSKLVLAGIILSSILITSSLGNSFAHATHTVNEIQDDSANVESNGEQTEKIVKKTDSSQDTTLLSNEVDEIGCTSVGFGGKLAGIDTKSMNLIGFKKVQEFLGFAGTLSDYVYEENCVKNEEPKNNSKITAEFYFRTSSGVVNFIEVYEDMKELRETGYPPFTITGQVELSDPVLYPTPYVMYGLNSKPHVTDKFEIILDVNLEESKFKNIKYNNCYVTKSSISAMDMTNNHTTNNNIQTSYYVDSFEFSCKGFAVSNS